MLSLALRPAAMAVRRSTSRTSAAAVLDASVDAWRLGDGGRRLVLEKRGHPEADDD